MGYHRISPRITRCPCFGPESWSCNLWPSPDFSCSTCLHLRAAFHLRLRQIVLFFLVITLFSAVRLTWRNWCFVPHQHGRVRYELLPIVYGLCVRDLRVAFRIMMSTDWHDAYAFASLSYASIWTDWLLIRVRYILSDVCPVFESPSDLSSSDEIPCFGHMSWSCCLYVSAWFLLLNVSALACYRTLGTNLCSGYADYLSDLSWGNWASMFWTEVLVMLPIRLTWLLLPDFTCTCVLPCIFNGTRVWFLRISVRISPLEQEVHVLDRGLGHVLPYIQPAYACCTMPVLAYCHSLVTEPCMIFADFLWIAPWDSDIHVLDRSLGHVCL